MLFGFEDRFAMFDMTPVDNQFIQEYLPSARGDDVRVYLYGLMRCYHPEENLTPARMGQDLNLTEEEIAKAYRYWERKGLVRRISDDPVSYQYVSLRRAGLAGEEIPLDPEYEAFAESLYGVFDHGRRLHGSEIRTCYEWVEDLKLPPEAVIMLLKHMERKKGKNFSIQSAEQTAVQMAQEGVTTVEEAEDFLSRDQEIYQGTRAVLKRLGLRNQPSEDQADMYRKWTREWGFTHQAIEEACAETAKGTPTMGYLDGILKSMRERATPGTPMDERGVRRMQQEGEALRRVLRSLGGGAVTEENLQLYRDLLEKYPEEMIQLAARECGESGGRLRSAGKMLESWSKKGIRTVQEAETYIRAFRAQSELLLELRKTWGLDGRMGARDRAMLATWQTELGFGAEEILAAADAAQGAEKPMPYLDRILRDYAARGIRTRSRIEAELAERAARPRKPEAEGAGRPRGTVNAQMYGQRDYGGREESLDEVLSRLKGERKSDA